MDLEQPTISIDHVPERKNTMALSKVSWLILRKIYWFLRTLLFPIVSVSCFTFPCSVEVSIFKRICEPQPGGSQHIYFFILSSFWLSFILHIIIIFLSSSNSLSFFYHLQIHCHFASASVVCLAIVFYMLKILYTTTYYCLYLYDKKWIKEQMNTEIQS